jgi:hypothetical protein
VEQKQLTCGEGLAAGAGLPAKLAELLAARAEVLERHRRALDAEDAAGRREIDAYTELVQLHRDISDRLGRLAETMRSHRDLPAAPHDAAVMADPRGQAEAFERFQALQRELADQLRES